MNRKFIEYLVLVGLFRSLGTIRVSGFFLRVVAIVLHGIFSVSSLVRAHRRMTRAQLNHAFPELDVRQRNRLYWDNLYSTLYSVIYESPALPTDRYVRILTDIRRDLQRGSDRAKKYHFKGIEVIEETRHSGVIFTYPHMHNLEIMGISALAFRPILFVYKKIKNVYINRIMVRNRKAVCDLAASGSIERHETSAMVRHLRQGGSLVIIADQYVRPVNPVEVVFFDTTIQVAPTLSRLALLGRAKIVPMYGRRDRNGEHYIQFQKPLELSETDHAHNTQLVFSHYEASIRACPSQYVWEHNRFFRQPVH